MHKEVRTPKAPNPVGPYSQAIQVDNMLFCSGQIALDSNTGQLVGKTAAEQAQKVMDNLRAILEEAGFTLKHVVKTTIFLTDLNSFSDVNQVYEYKFEGHKPARSTVEVSALPKSALVEIECVAVK